ncbi:hypothetical protein FOA43_002160 [Brettanomyces nanus]|uniref:SAC3/GANP/THP3 conserved domain-containing protein n=1 Tax=Eeniella nana TaxID=13502 RepID=A0A875S6L5_EENNA|nr:uncharacterized protein FOA43_002160 [Brettanomyces nanus]QPG74824.1 hypothetical protein FOA43_002160 [Brettanomyces nanus]
MKHYNSVAPRMSLKENKEQKNMRDPSNWPKPLHEFISNCFSKASEMKLPPTEKTKFQGELKNLINLAITKGKIEENDWTQQVLPSLERRPLKLDLYCNSIRHKTVRSFTPPNQNFIRIAIPKKRNMFDQDSDGDTNSGDDSYEPTINSTKIHPIKKLKKKTNNTSSMVNTGNGDRMTSEERKKLRGKRFQRELNYTPTYEPDIPNYDTNKQFVGKSTTLEKRYLRLTSQPNPSLVRPVHVLRKTFQLLMDKYLEGTKYNYLCDQLKSMRQDLTVQNIRTDFTAMVYEFHSKLAIEFADLGEFNQCQSQLKLLYNDPRIKGTDKDEYNAYRILYCIITTDYNEANNLKLQILGEKAIIDSHFLEDAFRLLNYVITGDYYRIFDIARQIRTKNEKDQKQVHTKTHIDILQDPNALKLNHAEMYFFFKFLEKILDRERMKTRN